MKVKEGVRTAKSNQLQLVLSVFQGLQLWSVLGFQSQLREIARSCSRIARNFQKFTGLAIAPVKFTCVGNPSVDLLKDNFDKVDTNNELFLYQLNSCVVAGLVFYMIKERQFTFSFLCKVLSCR